MSSKKVLIAGCGDVGTKTAELLAEQGHQIWGLRRHPQFPAFITPLAADLTQPNLAFPTAFDAVIYAAAADQYAPLAYENAYIVGVRHVIAALQRQTSPYRFIFISSSSVYAQHDGEWVDETSPALANDFGSTAILSGERLVDELDDGIVLRCTGIYGAHRRRLVDQVTQGQVSGDPDAFTNRIHRDDVAWILVHLLGLNAPERCYLAVDDAPVTQREVCEWLANQLGVAPPTFVPSNRERQMRSHKRCRNQRLRQSGWQPLYPTFREGYGVMLKQIALHPAD